MIRTSPVDFRKLAKKAATAADDKKAVNIVLLDIRHDSDVADYMVIAGAESTPQLRAIFEGVEDELRELGIRALHQEGHAKDRWLVLDYGGLLVHVLTTEARAFYRLEHIWEHPKFVDWDDDKPVLRRKK